MEIFKVGKIIGVRPIVNLDNYRDVEFLRGSVKPMIKLLMKSIEDENPCNEFTIALNKKGKYNIMYPKQAPKDTANIDIEGMIIPLANVPFYSKTFKEKEPIEYYIYFNNEKLTFLHKVDDKLYEVGLNGSKLEDKEEFDETITESLIRKQSLEQLKKVSKISKDTDIGRRIKKDNGENLVEIKNVLDGYVETYEQFVQRTNEGLFTKKSKKDKLENLSIIEDRITNAKKSLVKFKDKCIDVLKKYKVDEAGLRVKDVEGIYQIMIDWDKLALDYGTDNNTITPNPIMFPRYKTFCKAFEKEFISFVDGMKFDSFAIDRLKDKEDICIYYSDFKNDFSCEVYFDSVEINYQLVLGQDFCAQIGNTREINKTLDKLSEIISKETGLSVKDVYFKDRYKIGTIRFTNYDKMMESNNHNNMYDRISGIYDLNLKKVNDYKNVLKDGCINISFNEKEFTVEFLCDLTPEQERKLNRFKFVINDIEIYGVKFKGNNTDDIESIIEYQNRIIKFLDYLTENTDYDFDKIKSIIER